MTKDKQPIIIHQELRKFMLYAKRLYEGQKAANHGKPEWFDVEIKPTNMGWYVTIMLNEDEIYPMFQRFDFDKNDWESHHPDYRWYSQTAKVIAWSTIPNISFDGK